MKDTATVANKLRQHVIQMLANAGSGHSGGSLGMADIFAVLYFSNLFDLDPNRADEPNRDRIILSNGHICPIWYATLAQKGYFPIEELETLRQFNSRLQGHPHRSFQNNSSPHHLIASSPNNLPGIENTAGPLGQGTSFAVGIALGLRHLFQTGQINRLPKVICLTGDGELNEGQCWEAFMAAAKFKLNHLTFIIDRNDIQIDGFTHDVMPLEPLKDKLTGFGLCAIDINGHNHTDIYNALKLVSSSPCVSSPHAIIAHTVPGKGVSFMENKFEWHGKVPNHQEAEIGLKELQHVC